VHDRATKVLPNASGAAGLTFGVRSPALTIKGAKVTAFADLYVPVSNYCPKDPVSPILNSPVIRAGIMTIF
jgi:hypothetical protein